MTTSTLLKWRAQASGFAGLDDARVALQMFAAIDIALEEVETPVGRFIRDFDRQAELSIGR